MHAGEVCLEIVRVHGPTQALDDVLRVRLASAHVSPFVAARLFRVGRPARPLSAFHCPVRRLPCREGHASRLKVVGATRGGQRAASQWGDSNSTSPVASIRGQGAVGPVTCGSCDRLLTARARGCPRFADRLRTQHGPAPVRGGGLSILSGRGRPGRVDPPQSPAERDDRCRGGWLPHRSPRLFRPVQSCPYEQVNSLHPSAAG
jgi:hypothetical protein